MKENRHNFYIFFARMKTWILLSIFYVAGILSLAVLLSLSPPANDMYRHLLSALPFIWWGFAGIVMIVRQEAYLLFRVEGVSAIIIGTVLLLMNLFLVLMSFV